MYENCKFLSMVYISALTQASVLMKHECLSVIFKVIAKDTNNISYTVRYGFGRENSAGEEFALHADICNLGSAFLATDYMRFLQSICTEVQNMRRNRLSL